MTRRLQATVKEWSTEGGSAFLDDGTVVLLPHEALGRGPFRLLRPGQRVGLVLEEGTVHEIQLP